MNGSDENQYRVPTVDTILDICDVMLYRGLSLPIKQIRSIPQMESEMLRDLLHNTKRKLLEQIRSLQNSVDLIDKKQQTLERIEELRCKGFRVIGSTGGEVRAVFSGRWRGASRLCTGFYPQRKHCKKKMDKCPNMEWLAVQGEK